MGQLSAILAGEAYVRYFAPRDEFERDTRANEKAFNESVDRMAETRRRDAERQERERRREAERRQRQYQIDLATVTAGGLYFGNRISAAATNSLGGMLEAVKQYGTVEGYLNQIRGSVRDNTNAIEADMKRIERQAYALGESTEYDAADVAAGQNLLGKEDLNPSQIMASMPSVVNLASIFSDPRTGKIMPDMAAKSIMEILNSQNMGVDSIGSVVDKLAVAGRQTGITLQSLGDALRYAGGTASEAGVDFDELLATLVLLDKRGQTGTLGGTAVRGIISSLLDPTEAAIKEFEAFGINLPKDGKLSLVDILAQFEQKLGGLSNVERAAVISKAFPNRQMSGVQMLSSAGTAAQLQSMIGKFENSQGEGARVAATKREGISFALDVVDSTFQTLKAAFGKSIAREVGIIAKALAEAMSFVANALEKYPWIGKALGLIAVGLLGLGTAITTIGSIAGLVAFFGAFQRVLMFLTGTTSLLRGLAMSLALLNGHLFLTRGLLYAFSNSWAEGFVFLRFAIGSWVSSLLGLLLSPVVLGALLIAAAGSLVYVLDQEFNSGRLTNPIIKAVDYVFGGIYRWLKDLLGLTPEPSVKELPSDPNSMPGFEGLGSFRTDIIPVHLDQRPGETLNQYDDRKAEEKRVADFNKEMRTGFEAAWDVNSENPKNSAAWAQYQKDNAGDPKALADKGRWRNYLEGYRRTAGKDDLVMPKVGLAASRSLQNLGDFEMRTSAGVGLVLDLLTGKRDDDTAKRLLAEAEKTAAHTEEMAANLKPKRIGGRG